MFFTRFRIAGNHFIFLLLIHAAFVFIGIATTLLGVVTPALAARLNLDDAQSGLLFTIQYAGSLLGTLLSGFLWKRAGFRPPLIAGLTMMTIGVFGLGWLGWTGVAASVFFNGFGIGLTIPTINLLIASLNAGRASSALNILNFAWGCGALLSPAFFGFLGTSRDIRLPLGFLSGLLLLTALCLLFLQAATVSVSSSAAPPTESPKISQTNFIVLTAVLLFLYVGTESGVGGWITAYSLRLEAVENTLWSPATAAFWSSFLVGRLIAPLILKKLEAAVYVLFSLTAAALGVFVLLATTQIIFVTFGAALVGFGLAPIFPTVLGEFSRRLGERGARRANWLFISSTCGGAFLTWLVGFLSKTSGSLRIGFFAVFVCCLLMIALQIHLFIKFRKSPERNF